MGAGGGKTSTSSQSSPYAPILANMGLQSWRMAQPVESAYSSQAASALRTGGVNANIPSINAAVDAQRQAASQSDTQLRQRLAQSGLAGTPFAESILAQERGDEGAKIGAIPADATQAFLSQAIPTISNIGSRGISALSGAGSLDLTTKSTPSFWDFFTQGLGATSQGVGAGIGASMA